MELTTFLLNTHWETELNPLIGASKGVITCEYFLLLKQIWI